MTELDTDKNATPADPGAIDLEAIKNYRGIDQVFFAAAICDLIAAVEALWARVKDREAKCNVLAQGIADAAFKLGVWNSETVPNGPELLMLLENGTEAAEARVVELAGALAGLLGRLDSHFGGPSRNMDWKEQEYARAVLAATPARAMEMVPVPMLLWCPKCHRPHIDRPQPEKNWHNPPHRTHQCQVCGHEWRPANIPTVGVEALTALDALGKKEKEDA